MIYLCSPHWHARPAVRRARERQIVNITAALVAAGLPVLSPIVYSLPLQQALGEGWTAWRTLDLACVDAASELWIADQHGWRASVGTAREVLRYIERRMSPAEYVRVLNTERVLARLGTNELFNDGPAAIRHAYTAPLTVQAIVTMRELVERADAEAAA